MSARLRPLLYAAVVLLLASCVESDRPLSDVLKAAPDARLYGLWARTSESGDVDYLHIGFETSEPLDRARTEPEPGLMRYCTVAHSNQARGLGKAGEGRFYRTQINGEDFANWVIPADEAQRKPLTYCFLKYQVNDKQLILWDQDPEATAKAVERGQLKGVVKRKKNQGVPLAGEFDELRLTDTSENIAAFLAGGGDKTCFPDKTSAKTVYNRVR
jgi:hypothetical protein